MSIFITITTIILVTITLAPFAPSNHWIVRDWEFPRVQISSLLAANCLFILICLWAEPSLLYAILFTASMISLVYQLIWILPYTTFYKKQVPQAAKISDLDSISIMTSNVLMTNRKFNNLITLVMDIKPDVLVTLETDQRWQNELSCLENDYAYQVNRPLDNLYGMHLYSQLELRNIEVKDLVEEDVPSIQCEVKLRNNTWIQCYFLHPAPPSPTENTKSTPRDHELFLIAKKVQFSKTPTIVTGDLNDVAWSPTTRKFRHLSGLKDPRIGRGMFNTFHADYKFVRWPLDHVFHSTDFNLATISRLPPIGSDHFPLYTKLVFVKK